MAKFTTKKYTRPVLAYKISKLPINAFDSVNTLAKALSPRAGRKSAQFAALKKFVNLNKIFNNSTTRSSVQAAILSSLFKQFYMKILKKDKRMHPFLPLYCLTS